MVSASVLAHLLMCKRRKEGKCRTARSQQLVPPCAGNCLFIFRWHRRHLTSHHSPGHLTDWAPRRRCSWAWAGLAHPCALSLLSLLPVPFPPQALITLSTRGKLPSLQKRERSSLGSISIPIETAQTHQNGDTSIPDQTSGPSFFSPLTSFFFFLMHSLGKSKYKSKV